MSEIRDSNENIFALYSASDFQMQESEGNLFILYTEIPAGHQIQDSTGNILVFYTEPVPEPPPTVDCSFGSSFQPGVLKGQGVCE